MLIDIQVARCVDRQVEGAVPREQFEHVIEEANARLHVVPAFAVEADGERDLRFGRSAVDYGAAHKASSRTSMNRRVCSTMPVATRRQPSQPGSVERSRK